MNQIFLECLGIVSGILAVIGVLLNNRKIILCFYIWIVSNAISAYLHWYTELYSLLTRDLIFLILALEGWIKWNKK